MGNDYFYNHNLLPLNPKKVVITGGPSTGKTSVINNLEKKGYACIHEIIRTMTSFEKSGEDAGTFKTNPIVSVKDPKIFNQQLLDGRVEQFKTALGTSTDVIFFDRGIPDVHAYMDCFGQHYDKNFERPAYDCRYDHIFLMPPWREIHVVDNERFESFEEATRVCEYLEAVYKNFGYSVTLVPKGTIEERTTFILNYLELN